MKNMKQKGIFLILIFVSALLFINNTELLTPSQKEVFFTAIFTIIFFLTIIIFHKRVANVTRKKNKVRIENYQRLFNFSAIPILYLDYAEIKRRINKLEQSGKGNLRIYSDLHKNEINQLFSLLKVLEINQKGLELFEAERKENFIENILIHFNESSYDALREIMIFIAAGVNHFEYEMPIRKLSGKIKIFHLYITLLKGRKASQPNIMVSLLDVTEQKNAESKLIESEEKFRAIATNTPDIILIQDKLLRYTMAINPQLGMKEEEMLGKTDYELISEKDSIKLTEIKKRVIENGEAEYVQMPIVSLGGIKEYFEGSFVPKYDKQGAIDGIIGYFRNVTIQKIAEDALLETRERITNILSSIEDTFFSLDEQWRFTEVNQAASVAPFGRSAAELKGRVLWELYPNLLGTEIHEHYIYAVQNHSLEHFEIKSPLNGRWYEVFMQGRKAGVDVYMRDITERWEYENVLAMKNEELKKINDFRNKFFSIIAHDMKNPFISLIGSSELLIENANMYDRDKILKLTKLINDSAKSGYDMVINLLEWAKSQSGKLIFKLEENNLKELIANNLPCVFEFASLKKIKIKLKINSDLNIYADKNLLKSIFRNLINNAVKYTPSGGTVTIGAKNKNGNVTIYINDTGIGIERSDIDKIFRSDIKYCRPGTNREQGSGIGLVLCKEFIEKHGGKIWVDSEVDVGSTFYFNLSGNEN